jgi:hypothetical protein
LKELEEFSQSYSPQWAASEYLKEVLDGTCLDVYHMYLLVSRSSLGTRGMSGNKIGENCYLYMLYIVVVETY